MAALGSLVVSLAMDTAKFTGDIGKVSQQMARLTKAAGVMGAAIGAAVGTGIAAVSTLVKGSIDAADATIKMAQSAGVATEEFSKLAYAAELSGVSQDELAASFGRLSRFMAEAAEGGKGANDTLQRMGLTVKNTDGSLKTSSQLLSEIADKFQGYENGAQKTALAQDIFGKSGAKLIPFLNSGSKGLAELSEEALEFGIVLTDQAGKAAEQFNDDLTRLATAKQGLVRQVTIALLPALTQISGQMVIGAGQTKTFQKEIVEFSRIGAVSLATLADVCIFLAKTLRAIGGSFQSVFADFSALLTIGRASPQELADGISRGTGPVAAALENRRKVAAEANQRYIDLWSYDGARLSNAVRQAFSEEQRILFSIQNDPRELARRRRPNNVPTGPAPAVTPPKIPRGLSDAAKEAERLKNEAIANAKRVEELIGSLRFDVSTQALSDALKEEVVAARQLADLGARPELIDEYVRLIRVQQDFKKSIDDVAKSQAKQKEIEEEGLALTISLRTPLEILTAEYNRLDVLLSKNAISAGTYARAVAKAQEDFAKATEDTAETSDKYAERAAENIQGFLGDSLQQAMQGNFKSIGDAFVGMINRMVAEAIAADLARLIFGGNAGSQGTMGLFQQLLNFLPGMFGGRAIGGPVTAGNLYKTNEHRGGAYPITDEWFVPSTAGTVVPGSKMGGMNITVNVKATPGMSRQTALQQGRDIGRGIQLATARNG